MSCSAGAGGSKEAVGAAGCKTPLDYYVAQLQGLGYNVTCLTLTSAPLPEARPRLWILCSGPAASYSAEKWRDDILEIHKMADFPQHHLRAFFQKFGGSAKDVFKGAVARKGSSSWEHDASYAQSYSDSISKAIAGGRLDKGRKKIPEASRPSHTEESLEDLTPCQKAMVDVYSEIVAKLVAEAKATGTPATSLYPVADISQSTSRGHVELSGQWGTLCTSSRLMEMSTYRVLNGQGLMAMMGHALEDKVLVGLSQSDLSKMAGNGMGFTQLSKVLLPFVLQWMKRQDEVAQKGVQA